MHVFEIQKLDYDDADGFTNGTSNGTMDPAFRKIQKNCTGFYIWRVENMSVIALSKDNYGTFYDEDSYIIYASAISGTPASVETVAREVKGTTEVHIHFWLGSCTTADKSGVAAYKTVELDSYLGGNAVEHRETQGNESPRFKSYFKNGLKILKNANSAGIKEIISIRQPKMFQIKGRRSPILTQLDSISWNYFSSADVFVIQTESRIFIWLGRASNSNEKLHSTKIASKIKEGTGITNITFIDDGYEQTMSFEEKKEFQKYLPLDKRHVMPPQDDFNDGFDKNYKNNLKLYRCSDNGGKYRVAEIKFGPLQQTDLDSDEVFIVDYGWNGIWVWVGRRASERERVEAMRNARGFVKKKKYPNNTRVCKVVEGFESLEFKMLFQNWREKDDTKGKVISVAKRIITKFDALTMSERPSLAAEMQLVDGGSGTTRMWRIMGCDAVEIPKEKFGTFFTGDCYIIWYNYNTDSSKHIIYYWMGLNASNQEMSIAETKAMEIEEQLDSPTVRTRVVQGYEPAQFLQLFKGKMITYKGQSIDYDETGRNLKHPTNYLLQIHGSSTFSSKATQVNCKAHSLNSNYCFVLKRGKHYFVWCGNTSTGDQREMAKYFTGKDFEIVLEGKEPNEFWDLLGGKAAYNTTKSLAVDGIQKPARLFQCIPTREHSKIEELFNYSQEDLIPEDVMLLDALDVIFVWIGSLGTKEVARSAVELAKEYLKNDPCGRDQNVPIEVIRQECEPPNFIGFFSTWDQQFWKNYKCFEEVRQATNGSESISRTKIISKNQSIDDQFDKYDKYPISVLKGPSEKLPAKVDSLRKELHLTHDDFVFLFKMGYEEFEILPRWKQQELKKKVGLF